MTIDLLSEDCLFDSERLLVSNCTPLFRTNKMLLADKVLEILTPEVAKALPPGWQQIETAEQALKWLEDRFDECFLLSVRLKQSNEIVGFIFNHQGRAGEPLTSVNIGYLIAQSHWGRGYASEVLAALVDYYQSQTNIDILYAGVESDNLPSIRVLEKCGFGLSQAQTAPPGNLFYGLRLER